MALRTIRATLGLVRTSKHSGSRPLFRTPRGPRWSPAHERRGLRAREARRVARRAPPGLRRERELSDGSPRGSEDLDKHGERGSVTRTPFLIQ